MNHMIISMFKMAHNVSTVNRPRIEHQRGIFARGSWLITFLFRVLDTAQVIKNTLYNRPVKRFTIESLPKVIGRLVTIYIRFHQSKALSVSPGLRPADIGFVQPILTSRNIFANAPPKRLPFKYSTKLRLRHDRATWRLV